MFLRFISSKKRKFVSWSYMLKCDQMLQKLKNLYKEHHIMYQTCDKVDIYEQ